jgi:hypothetical protein
MTGLMGQARTFSVGGSHPVKPEPRPARPDEHRPERPA